MEPFPQIFSLHYLLCKGNLLILMKHSFSWYSKNSFYARIFLIPFFLWDMWVRSFPGGDWYLQVICCRYLLKSPQIFFCSSAAQWFVGSELRKWPEQAQTVFKLWLCLFSPYLCFKRSLLFIIIMNTIALTRFPSSYNP